MEIPVNPNNYPVGDYFDGGDRIHLKNVIAIIHPTSSNLNRSSVSFRGKSSNTEGGKSYQVRGLGDKGNEWVSMRLQLRRSDGTEIAVVDTCVKISTYCHIPEASFESPSIELDKNPSEFEGGSAKFLWAAGYMNECGKGGGPAPNHDAPPFPPKGE